MYQTSASYGDVDDHIVDDHICIKARAGFTNGKFGARSKTLQGLHRSFSCLMKRPASKPGRSDKRRYWKLAGSLGWFVAKSRIGLAGGNAGGQGGARLSRCDARSAMGDRRS